MILNVMSLKNDDVIMTLGCIAQKMCTLLPNRVGELTVHNLGMGVFIWQVQFCCVKMSTHCTANAFGGVHCVAPKMCIDLSQLRC